MAWGDSPEDVAGLEIKPPPGGAPSQAVPGLDQVMPPTPTEQREAAEARAKEEGVKAAPVETSEEREAPLPPNPVDVVTKIVTGLQQRVERLTQELADERAENRKMSEELNG